MKLLAYVEWSYDDHSIVLLRSIMLTLALYYCGLDINLYAL